jgi:hypothetical protein
LIDTLVKWTFGKGFKANDKDMAKLKKIVGNGKETALRVFKNLKKVSYICGGAFAHIIKDNQGRITNLKALNSQRMRVVYNPQGIIVGFDQLDVSRTNTIGERFSPDEILYIQNGRIGDEMGGHSIFEAIEQIILNRNEVIADLKILFHRFVVPIKVWEAKTSSTPELQALEVKISETMKKFENLVIPEGTLGLKEIMAVPTQTGGLSPLEYYKELIRVFICACGVPEVIMGWTSSATEGNSKIVYLAWQQTIEECQLEFEEDVEMQLNIEINLEFPIDITQTIQETQNKNGNSAMGKEKPSEIKPMNPMNTNNGGNPQ